MEALEEETEEDLRLLAGVGDEELSDGVFMIARGRFVWLVVNLGTAILAATVISQFTDTIRAFVALAVLMPIVASMGGNAGTQALTVTVRAIATRSLSSANVGASWCARRWSGSATASAFATAIGLSSGLFFQDAPAWDGDRHRDDRQSGGRGLRRGADPDRAREAEGRSGAGVGDASSRRRRTSSVSSRFSGWRALMLVTPAGRRHRIQPAAWRSEMVDLDVLAEVRPWRR